MRSHVLKRYHEGWELSWGIMRVYEVCYVTYLMKVLEYINHREHSWVRQTSWTLVNALEYVRPREPLWKFFGKLFQYVNPRETSWNYVSPCDSSWLSMHVYKDFSSHETSQNFWAPRKTSLVFFSKDLVKPYKILWNHARPRETTWDLERLREAWSDLMWGLCKDFPKMYHQSRETSRNLAKLRDTSWLYPRVPSWVH